MSETIQIGEIAIALTLKDVDNVHLSVHPPDGQVSLVAPTSTRLDVARAYAISKLTWIRRQQHQFKKPSKRNTSAVCGTREPLSLGKTVSIICRLSKC